MPNYKVKRQKLRKKQYGSCFYCKCFVCMNLGFDNTITIDHVIPKSKGGTRLIENMVGACMLCNNIKQDMSVNEFMKLLLNEQLYKIKLEQYSCGKRKDNVLYNIL